MDWQEYRTEIVAHIGGNKIAEPGTLARRTYLTLGLVAESEELLRELENGAGDNAQDGRAIVIEAGDTAWYLAALDNEFTMPMETAENAKIEIGRSGMHAGKELARTSAEMLLKYAARFAGCMARPASGRVFNDHEAHGYLFATATYLRYVVQFRFGGIITFNEVLDQNIEKLKAKFPHKWAPGA